MDVQFTYDTQPQVMEAVVAGTGVVSHSANLRAVYVSTGGTASGASCRFTSKFYVPYTPGNSQLVFLTGALNPDNVSMANSYTEIGYGDDKNGIGFRMDANGVSVFIRTTISGTTSLVQYYQDEWQAAKSGVDWTKSQIFGMDVQSLAVGRVRFFLDRAGVVIPIHSIRNDNIRTGPYWQMASLPIYWMAHNSALAGVTARVLAVCGTVKSEGGGSLFSMPGFPFTAYTTSAHTISSTLVPIISICNAATINSLTNRQITIPTLLDVFALSQPIMVRVLLNPTSLTTVSWVAAGSNSGVQYDVSATAVSGGTVISSFYVTADNRGGSSGVDLTGRVPLSLDFAGTSSAVLTVAAIRAGAVDATAHATISGREIR